MRRSVSIDPKALGLGERRRGDILKISDRVMRVVPRRQSRQAPPPRNHVARRGQPMTARCDWCRTKPAEKDSDYCGRRCWERHRDFIERCQVSEDMA